MSARKAYRPKPRLYNALERAIVGARRLPDAAARAERAMEALTGYNAAEASERATRWRHMADCVNISLALAELGIASDEACRQFVRAGNDALVDAQADGMGAPLGAERYAALDNAMWLHGVQLRLCSATELNRAIATVVQRGEQAQRGNAPPGVRVVQVSEGRP